MTFNLRVIPWWTDDCSTFLNNMFKWLPTLLKRQLIALEFGGGNSTFYLLAKGLKVVTVESDDEYIEFIHDVGNSIGYKVAIVCPNDFEKQLLSEFQLIIIKAKLIAETENILHKADWDFIVNDGISRREVLQEIHSANLHTVVILDNVELCANWGRLDRSSAKPELVKVYRSILRDKNWKHYIFEQPEGREGRGSPDKTGWESPHRWASSVLWPENHLLAQLMVSNEGFPIVNDLGIDDFDIKTLEHRCPFDWEKMKWVKEPFPAELDLKLSRRYD